MALLVALCAVACTDGGDAYDAGQCDMLAAKVERHDNITQQDYALMIAQCGHILADLAKYTARLRELPDDRRLDAERFLHATPAYRERMSYICTFDAALADAAAAGLLNDDNSKAYDELDSYNESIDTE